MKFQNVLLRVLAPLCIIVSLFLLFLISRPQATKQTNILPSTDTDSSTLSDSSGKPNIKDDDHVKEQPTAPPLDSSLSLIKTNPDSPTIPQDRPTIVANVAGVSTNRVSPAANKEAPIPPASELVKLRLDQIPIDLSTPEAREQSVALMGAWELAKKEEAIAWAEKHDHPIFGKTPNGGDFSLQRLDENGSPVHAATNNSDAAISSNIQRIRFPTMSEGNGSGWTVGVWDGGKPLSNHQEFTGRFDWKGNTNIYSEHATHVGGTIAGAGIVPDAMGMAPGASMEAYSYGELPLSSLMKRAASSSQSISSGSKLAISNHSWGYPTGWEKELQPSGAPNETPGVDDYYWLGRKGETEASNFGRYDSESRAYDDLCYEAPFHLPIKSAGNSRNRKPGDGDQVHYKSASGTWITGTEPDSTTATFPGPNGKGSEGFDSLPSFSNAKNLLIVGNCKDLTTTEDGNVVRNSPNKLELNASSSIGPTDDGRIKPDLVANGTKVYSAGILETSETSTLDHYETLSGTSMAAPTVSGAAVLLQQLHTNLFHEPMRASMLKGLLIQTTDGVGSAGPDYLYGHGIMNAKRAWDHIQTQFAAQDERRMYDGILVGGTGTPGEGLIGNDTEEFFIEADGSGRSLYATLCWIDPPGTRKTAADDRTPVLVHDLDVRIYPANLSNGPVLPWTLNYANPSANAVAADNTVDNIEKLGGVSANILESNGPWRVVISNKGLTEPAKGELPEHPKVDLLLSDANLKQNLPAQVFSFLMSGARSIGSFVDATESYAMNWRMGGANSNYGWFPQTAVSSDGSDAAQSPPMASNTESSFQTDIYVNPDNGSQPWFVSFAAKTDGTPGAQFRCELNGSIVFSTNSSSWQNFEMELPFGSQNLNFVFNNGSGGRAWVDQIAVLPRPSKPAITALGAEVNVAWTFNGRPSSGYRILRNSSPTEVGAEVKLVGGENDFDHREILTSSEAGSYFAVAVLDQHSRVYSPLSEWSQAGVAPPIPGSPTASSGLYQDRIVVTWYGSGTPEEHVLTRTPEGGSPEEIVIPLSSGTSYTDTNVVPGQLVSYTVRARTNGVSSAETVADTGFAFDSSVSGVQASDGTLPGMVNISWGAPPNLNFRVLRTETNVSPADGNNTFIEVAEVGKNGVFWNPTRSDQTALPGLTYYYWVQMGSPDTPIEWGDFLGSDAGSAGPAAEIDYIVTDSDDVAGPIYQWIDVSNTGRQVAGLQLITPESVTSSTNATDLYPVENLVNDSGLIGTPNLANYTSITHAFSSVTNSWVTEQVAPPGDYYSSLPPPVLEFEFPGSSVTPWIVSDLIIWGYNLAPNGNEAKRFQIEFMEATVVGGMTVLAPTGESIAVESNEVLAGAALRIPFGADYAAAGVRVTILDNWLEASPGGDRVGLGEVKFVGKPNLFSGLANTNASIYGNPSGHVVSSMYGYLGDSDGTEQGDDANGDCPLPANPGNGSNGIRVMPYHSDLVFDPGGGVFHEVRFNEHPHGEFGEWVDIWQWKDVRLSSGGSAFDFQVLHFETSGDFIFQYPPGHPGGGDATIGIQDWTQLKAATFACQKNNSLPTEREFAVLFDLTDTTSESQQLVHTISTGDDEDDGALDLGKGNSLRELIKYGPVGPDTVLRISAPPNLTGSTTILSSSIDLDERTESEASFTTYRIDASSAPGYSISGGLNPVFIDAAVGRNLTLVDLTLRDSLNQTGPGGAIASGITSASVARTISLERVTITGCSTNAGNGGAIAILDFTNLSIINSTLVGNTASSNGGAIWLSPGSSKFTIVNSTICHNNGGGIRNDSSSSASSLSTLSNSIVALSNNGADVIGNAASGGANIIEDVSLATGLAASDITSQDPLVGTLLSNTGGNTPTLVLLPGSPAIDSGTVFLPTDQRGQRRGISGDLSPTGSRPDIGAFELVSPLIVTTSSDTVDPNDGALSLREAILSANASQEGYIRFNAAAMAATTINLTDELPISSNFGISIDGNARAAIITDLGDGEPALLGSDFTDPENNFDYESGTGGNWATVRPNAPRHPTLANSTAANPDPHALFDNSLTAGSPNWWGVVLSELPAVTVQMPSPVSLSHFTIASGGSTVGPGFVLRQFQILGSYDGNSFELIYSYDGDPLFTRDLQVLQFDLQRQTQAYRYFQLQLGSGNPVFVGLGELEFFSNSNGSAPLATERITLSGNNSSRIFNNTGVASLHNLTIRDGSSGDSGGGIVNSGSLTLTDCEVHECSASDGGGIVNNGQLGLVRSTVAENTATNDGGGIFNNGGSVSLVQSTIANNTGEGLINTFDPATKVHVLASTISGNSEGGIVSDPNVPVVLQHSVVAGNEGGNLFGDPVERLGSNVSIGDPLLAPLAYYGGPNRTRPPMTSSAALDGSPNLSGALIHPSNRISSSSRGPVGAEPTAAIDGDPSTAFEGFSDGLVALWDFNGDPGERVGGYDAFLIGGATLSNKFQSTYVQDFEGFANGTTDLSDGSTLTSDAGVAEVNSGALDLTNDSNQYINSAFRIPQLSGATDGWTMSFDFTITATGIPADGLSFSWGSIPASGTSGNENGWGGAVEHLAFSIDTFGTNNGTRISHNGTTLAQQTGTITANDSPISATATISWDPVDGASFHTTGLPTNASFTNVPTPNLVQAEDHLFAFAARTAFYTQTFTIDNLKVYAGPLEGQVLSLTGALNQCAIIPDAGDILNPIAANEEFTISWWQRQDTLLRSASFFAFSPSTNNNRAIGGHFPWGPDDKIYYDTAGCCNPNTERINGPTPSWVDWSEWNHISLIRNGAKKEVWINGRLALGGVGTETLPTDITELRIGGGITTLTSLNGALDDFAIYNRALTPSEIAVLASRDTTTPEADLLINAPGAPTHLVLTSAADRPETDPTGFQLEGSNDGETFAPLASGTVPDFAQRSTEQLITLPPLGYYEHFRLVLNGSSGQTSVRIAEVQLLFNPDTDQRGLPRHIGVASDLGSVEAGEILVDTPIDENNGIDIGAVSLRDAIAASAEASIIRFDPLVFDGEPGDIINLTNGELAPVLPATSIDASTLSNKVEISGDNSSRVINLSVPSQALSLNGIVIRNGATSADGGGIRNQNACLILNYCDVRDNHSGGGGGGIIAIGGSVHATNCSISDNNTDEFGGGLKLRLGALGVLDGCTIEGNSSNLGGGIQSSSSTLLLSNCTIDRNQSANQGGGISNANGSATTVLNSTITDNISGTAGRGITNQAGALLTMGNSIVAGEFGTHLSGGISVDLGNNFTVGDPRLAPLGFYGGPTPTRPPLHDSPALNAGNNALPGLAQTDQRGYSRISGANVDIGAVESHALAFVLTADRDADGMADEWEIFHGLDHLFSDDALLDLDGDGLNNIGEYLARTNAAVASSNLEIISLTVHRTELSSTEIEIEWTSTPEVIYSIWHSPDLVNWTPVPNTNLIAVQESTRLVFERTSLGSEFYQVRTGTGDSNEPSYAEFRSSFAPPVGFWSPHSIQAESSGTAVISWNDETDTLNHFLPASGAPSYLAGVTPTGLDAIDFAGGTHDDTLLTSFPLGQSALDGATALTVAIAFRPDGEAEDSSGSNWYQKARLVSGDVFGMGNDWALTYGNDQIYFAVGSTGVPSVSLQVSAGTPMPGEWWIAVVTWMADDGSGAPGFAAWLYDNNGTLIGSSGVQDPNTLAGTVGAFNQPRADIGITLGAFRQALTSRNYDGLVAALQVYNQPANQNIASQIAEEFATKYTTDAEPE